MLPLLQPSSVFHKNIISHIPLYRWENKGMANEKIWRDHRKTSSNSGKRTQVTYSAAERPLS